MPLYAILYVTSLCFSVQEGKYPQWLSLSLLFCETCAAWACEIVHPGIVAWIKGTEREREERVVFYNLLVCVFIWLLTKHTLLCQKIQKQLVKHHGKRHFYYWCTNATLPPHTCIFHTENKPGTFSILTSSSTLIKTNSFMNLYKLFCCFRHLYDHNMPMRVVNLFLPGWLYLTCTCLTCTYENELRERVKRLFVYVFHFCLLGTPFLRKYPV